MKSLKEIIFQSILAGTLSVPALAGVMYLSGNNVRDYKYSILGTAAAVSLIEGLYEYKSNRRRENK